jgi:hypothetical protein
MNIRTVDLKKFQGLSSHIQPTGILPSSDCIRFGGGVIVKNALSSFVSFECAASTDDVLVDEFVLYGLLNNTRAEFINIFVKDKKVMLSDGLSKIPVAVVDFKTFPELPKPETKKQEITDDFLKTIGQLSDACAEKKADTSLYMFVHVGDNMMAAGNGWMGVCFPIDEDYKMVIERNVAKFISKQKVYAWAESEGHHFFYGHDGVFFGFSKSVIGFSSMGSKMNGGDERAFTISASDVVSFNSLAISLSTEKDITLATMAPGQFEMENTTREIPCVRPYEGLKVPEPWHYNPKYMNSALAAFGAEELDFYPSKNAYFIKSTETKATAIIAKMSK